MILEKPFLILNFVKESNEIDFITPDNTSDGWLRKKMDNQK